MTIRSLLPCVLFTTGVACGIADASPESPNSLDTAVAALATTDSSTAAVSEAAPLPTDEPPYPRLRRSYSQEAMQLHGCASLRQDGSIVGHGCPAGIIAVGPRVVVPTHSDVRCRFDIESPESIELSSDIVSDKTRRTHGRLDEQSLAAHEKRTISYSVHVFEAAPTVEVRIAVGGREQLDFRITNLTVDVR